MIANHLSAKNFPRKIFRWRVADPTPLTVKVAYGTIVS
jgi:hypothetical protein